MAFGVDTGILGCGGGICAALQAISGPDSTRIDEDAGLFSLPARAVNKLLDEFADRQRQYQFAAQRYRLMAKLSNDVTFEFDLIQDTICDSTNWDVVVSGKQFVEGTIARQIVHQEDAARFLAFFRSLKKAGEFYEAELRLRTQPEGEYHWMQVHGVVLADQNGQPEKILGRRFNIDKLKREKDDLLDQAQRDLLTGLYNKKTAERMMIDFLDEQNGCGCALLAIDIDYFKEINDSLGHQAGDEVLLEAAAGIAALFRKEDIVGRTGGDEFLVLFKSSLALTEKVLSSRCEQILGVFRDLPASARYNHVFSCSIGIDFCELGYKDFSTLYHHADIALYDAKGLGRGCFAFYKEPVQE